MKIYKKKVKNIISLFSVLLAAVLITVFFSRLLTPKYMSDVTEGAFVAEYYKEEVPHDVIFLGDCEAYENISPVTLWNEFGISSYIRGTPQQLVWQSYYLLEETLKYETPECVVYNVLPMKYGEPQSEAYNRLTLDGMKMSKTKLKSVKTSMTEDEKLIEYIIPALRYHTRITELTKDDFRYFFKRDTKTFSGYYMRTDVKPAADVPPPPPLADYSFSDMAWEYLDKMRCLCEEKGIDFMLMKAPSLYPYWYDEWDRAIADYAEKYGLIYLNALDKIEETGIDFSTDTYDGGLHLNVYGAEKLSKWIGLYVKKSYNIPDRRNDVLFSEIWEDKTKFYEEAKVS